MSAADFRTHKHYSVILITNAEGLMVVDMKPDGSVVFGPGFTTQEEAAKLFWECLGSLLPK